MLDRNKKLKRELKQAVERKRRRQMANTPCAGCGEKPLGKDPMSRVRLVDDVDAEPCKACATVAAENGFQIVTMVRPCGLGGTDSVA